MSQTRKTKLGASLSSAFGAMPESAIVRAAKAKDGGDDDTPLMITPDRGSPILLVPGKNDMRAYDIKPRRGVRIPKPPFDTRSLIGNPKFVLKPIESRVVEVQGKEIRIKDGRLERSLESLNVQVLRWGEIPHPHRHRPPHHHHHHDK